MKARTDVLFSVSGQFTSDCHCCQASDYKSLLVSVVCSDGHRADTEVVVPTQCGCLQCSTISDFKTEAGNPAIINGPHHLIPSRVGDVAEIVDLKTQDVNIIKEDANHKSNLISERVQQRRGMVSLEDIFGTENRK